VQLARLFGANKEYINNKIPHISNLMVPSIQEILDHAEVIVIGNQNPEFRELVENLQSDHLVIDYVRIVKELEKVKAPYDGLCW
jgi:GDP-mannose 6-dehydrogenase